MTAALTRPTLATPDQIATEKMALALFARDDVRAAMAKTRLELLKDPAAKLKSGLATLDRALNLWAFATMMRHPAGDTARPIVVWPNDPTPHTWFGHTFPGTAASGENPDNVYRSAYFDHESSYEVTGKLPANPPTQFTFELAFASPGGFAFKEQSAATPDLGDQLGMLNERILKINADGTFKVTIDPNPANGRINHLQSRQGKLLLNLRIRNTFSDWTQRPIPVSVRRLSGPPAGPPLDENELARRVIADIPGYCLVWAAFKNNWMGNPPTNTLAGPVPRDGGWGFLAGGRFDIADDEAIIVTSTDANALYTGMQIVDPWAVAPHADRNFISRNNTQCVKGKDGRIIYVIAKKDPGVFNWIDTAGLNQGLTIMRWQAVSPDAKPKEMLQGYEVVKASDLKKRLPADTVWVTPAEREKEREKRIADFNVRMTA